MPTKELLFCDECRRGDDGSFGNRRWNVVARDDLAESDTAWGLLHVHEARTRIH